MADESLCRGRAQPDRATHAGAAEAAIAERILGEVLLVVILGVIERRRVEDLAHPSPGGSQRVRPKTIRSEAAIF
jgi:hypothetical protein